MLAMVCTVGLSGAPVEAQSGLGFRFEPGYQNQGSEWGRLLDPTADVDFALLFEVDRFRFGAGINWTSMRLAGVPDESWQHTAGRLIVGYAQPLGARIRLSTEMAYVRRNARPEGSRLFDDGPPTEHIGPFRAKGDGLDGRLALEVGVGETTALSLSGAYQRFQTHPHPADVMIPEVDAGSAWRLGIGLTWFPVESRSAGTAASPSSGPTTPGPDARSGAGTRNPGLAVGVGALGLLLPWSWNEYVKGKPFTPVSPRSWGRGVSYGLGWDDNDFEVNYFRHPYHGQFYFNAARSNGYGFGASVLQTVIGSYLWECCTETHVPSLPDMITTVVGGAALGESLHRISTAIVDERVWGVERVARETATALLDPARGITRLATGRAWLRTPTTRGGSAGRGAAPSRETLEATGSGRLRVDAGVRFIPATDGAPSETRPLVALAWRDGDPYSAGNGLFSYHRMDVALYPGDRALLGAFDIRGALWRSGPDEAGDDRAGGPDRRVSLYLDVDYVDSNAYRFATQSLTGALAWRMPLTARTRLGLELEASLVPIGSVDSDYARLAPIRGVREREREYDFGAGGGARLGLSLYRDGDAVVETSYRFVALETLHGSNVEGSRSHHLVHRIRAAIRYPLAGVVGVGIDGDVLLQDSRYGFAAFDDARATHPEIRVFIAWRPGA